MRKIYLTLIALLSIALPGRAELLQADLSIYGMD